MREHEPPVVVGVALVVDLNGPSDEVEVAASRAAGIGRATLAGAGRSGAVRVRSAGPSRPGSSISASSGAGRTRHRRARRPPAPGLARRDGARVNDPGTPTPARGLRACGSPWRLVAVPVAIALGAVGAIAASRIGFPLAVGALAGAVAALLGVFALPSLSTRRVVVVLLGLGGLGALRHASFSGSDTSPLLVCWAAATLVALLLVDRTGAEQLQPLPRGVPLGARTGEIVRLTVTTAVMVAIAVVALGPTLTNRLGRHVWPGLDPSIGAQDDAPSSLTDTPELDMTQRPRLTDRVVFTVDASRAEFWRGETFDVWNGHEWSRSEPLANTLPHQGNTSLVTPAVGDVGAIDGQPMRQTFHLESGYSNVIFAAPSPVAVETDRVVAERDDGTVTVGDGFGKGATYTVLSRSALPTASSLRVPPTPRRCRSRAAPVRTAAANDRAGRALAREITATAPTTYDKIAAIEHGSARTSATRSTLRSHPGESTWSTISCSVRASAGASRLRAASSSWRAASGSRRASRPASCPGTATRSRGSSSCASDAHVWAEVYFPGVGWQPFDPTAKVPLAGDAGTSGSWLQAARHHAVELGLLAAALVLAVVAAPDLLNRWRRRRARRRSSWAAQRLTRLERIGRRPGGPGRLGDAARIRRGTGPAPGRRACPRAVGETLDADGFSVSGASSSARAAADAVLSSL